MHPTLTKLCYFLTLCSCLFSCNNKTSLIPKDLSSENERNNTLFAFVGEKIEVRYIPEEDTSALLLQGKYFAKYKVLQNVYGDFKGDTIEFTAFDHYGEPAFSNYKNVLLFVSKRDDKYYHKTYQFYDVYRTKDNRWAGRYSVRDLGYDNKRNKNVSAQKIEFLDDPSIPLSVVNKKEIGCWFPEPYYKIENDKAIAVYGNYIEDLFRIKKEGVLRGLFGNGEPKELDVIDTELAEVSNFSREDWKKFESFWNQMIKSKDSFNIKRLIASSMDSIYINDTLLPVNNSQIRKIFTKELLHLFKDSTEREFGNYDALKNKTTYPVYRAETVVDTVNTFEIKMIALFIKVKESFKFYGIKEKRECICWQ